MSIVEFLNARIDEDETEARKAINPPWRSEGLYVVVSDQDAPADGDPKGGARWHPKRVLAECEAKRQVVALAGIVTRGNLDGPSVSLWADRALRSLAAVYAEHPLYRDEWRL